MPARPFNFMRSARSPMTWGAFAIMTCLTAYAVNAPVPWWLAATWATIGLVTAFHLLRSPVTKLRLDETGLTTKQGRSPSRHFPKDDIAGLEHFAEANGPGLLNVVMQNGQREVLTLLQLPKTNQLAAAAAAHGVSYAQH